MWEKGYEMTETIVSSVLRLFLDGILTLFFFADVSPKLKGTCRLAVLFLLITGPLYIPIGNAGYISSTLLRFTLRTAAVCGYLWFGKKRPLTDCLYFALYFSIILTVCQNIFLISKISSFRTGALSPFKNPWMVMLTARAVEYCVTALILIVMRKYSKISLVQHAGLTRFTICVGVVIIQIYVKWTLYLQVRAGLPSSISNDVFTFLVLLCSLAVLVLNERGLRDAEQEKALREEKQMLSYQYEKIKDQVSSSEQIQALHHDMKNHLAVIQALKEDPKRQQGYIDSLIDEIAEMEPPCDTGNAVVDGLLALKTKRASDAGISMNICADLQNSHGISDIDLCTIFANAIDNAIEAASQIPEQKQRHIRVRAGLYADFLVLRFENPFVELPVKKNGNYISIKKDSELHGFGLRNINNCAKRYDGTAIAENTPDHIFRLIVTLHCPTA